MAFLLDAQSRKTALDFAGSRPIEGFDPGFVERLKADFSSMRDFSNSNARVSHIDDVQQEFQREFFKASGQSMNLWMLGGQSQPKLEEAARSQFEAWKTQNPESDLEFPENDYFEQEAQRRAGESRSASELLASESTSWSSTLGGFAGTMAGALTDPINIVSLAVGAGAASGIVRTALIEAGIGAASETVIQGITYDFKKKVDPDFGVADAGYEVAAAGAGGALFGGGVKAIAKAWQGARGRYFPREVQDAANVATREAATPENPASLTFQEKTVSRSALEKAAEDIAAGRPIELPPEAFLQSQARPGRVYDAEGGSIGVLYEVVDAAELKTSHNDDFGINPEFPQQFQPRDRTRAISQDQVQSIYSNLQPERLGPSPQAESGAPIVGGDGLVESGNARVMALRKAYQEGGVQSENYRNFLKSQGYEIDSMAAPVLIGRRITDMDDIGRVRFVNAANRSTAMRLGASEQAMADARLFDTKVLDALADGEVTPLKNQNFTRGFLSRLPRSEQGNLVDGNGVLSVDGERRITAAMMARAYGDADLLSRALEEPDGNIKTIAGAMADVSGKWAKMRDAVANGQLPRGMDITDSLLEAVRLVMRSRDEKVAMADLLKQAEMFDGPSEISKLIARSLFSDGSLKRGASRQKVSRFIDDYLTEAMKNDAGDRLFGEPLGAADVLKIAVERTGRDDLFNAADNALTPERIDEIAESPETQDAVIMEVERIRASGGADQLIDLEDGLGPRSLDEIMNEADDDIAAATELEACATGSRQEAG